MKQGVRIWRDQHGIPHVEAADPPGLCWGQGYVHAVDRPVQLLLMRIVGQGRVSELLDSSESSLHLDFFFRRVHLLWNLRQQVEMLTPEARCCLDQYCDGVNQALAEKRPWELKLVGYRPEPWRPEDTILMSRVLPYAMLVHTQADIERLLLEMVQAGVPREKLDELFPGLLGELDVELVKQVRLGRRVVPPEVFWGTAIPRMTASNNWVLSGVKTASGQPILANDPHLEGNRLPNVWSEVALHWADRWALGATMPGGPGILIGRTPELAWGVTYAFADAVDSWIERCRDGKFFREPDQWVPFHQRREVLLRKKKKPVEFTAYENDHGVLDGDPNREGYYLATRWAADELGRQIPLPNPQDARRPLGGRSMDHLGQVETAWSWVLADRQGNIGFQMSGLVPRRREGANGFVPLPGWKKENDWLGFVGHEELPRVLNPEQGYFATANQDLNAYGRSKPINAVMAPYRANRIAQLLDEQKKFTPADMFAMHFDLYSLQAEAFMDILRPLLPQGELRVESRELRAKTPNSQFSTLNSPLSTLDSQLSTLNSQLLREWDLCYALDSRGAFLFEQFYGLLLREVFGRGGLGEAVVDHLADRAGSSSPTTSTSTASSWPRIRPGSAAARATKSIARSPPRPWPSSRGLGARFAEYMLRHLLFGGKLPAFLGFDRGPVSVPGGRATIHQMQMYRSDDRVTTFVPSFRMVTDLATDQLHTNLAGGPSDRRFSRWYCSDLKNWLAGKYKTITPDGTQKRFRFP